MSRNVAQRADLPHLVPHAGITRLGDFVGSWASDGFARSSPEDLAVGGNDPLPARMCGTQIGEWGPGAQYVIHHWDERVGDEPSRGLWLMGYDRETLSYPVHMFADNGDIAIYVGKLQGNVWTFSGERQRATIVISDDGASMHQRWWDLDGTRWVPLCDLRVTRGNARDDDLSTKTPDELIAEVRRLRTGIREHRDQTGQALCWHQPKLWGLLPERSDPRPTVPNWSQFMRGCVRYRQSLDEQLPAAPRSSVEYDGETD